jgi:DNA-binding response OmpR family regulator
LSRYIRAITSQPFPEKKRILVVNDEPDMTRMLKMTLERIGFIVDMFNDPVLAFRGFRQPVK